MAFRNVNHYLKEATSGFFVNKFMTWATIVTVTAALILLGLFFLIGANFKEISQQIQSDCEIRVVIDPMATVDEEKQLYEKIKMYPHIKTVYYESEEEALENYKKIINVDEYENDPFEGISSDILRSYIVITMQDLSYADDLVGEIEKMPNVLKVINRKDTVDAIITFTTILRNGSLISMIFLLVIAFFIISNTIKLSVHSREEEIHIMKYIGATDRFIRWPFIIEGIFVGFIGAIFASLILYWSYYGIIILLKNTLDIFNFVSASKILFPLIALLFGFGCLIGAYASMFSLRKHLKV